jgi:hypothetical protein
MLRKYLFDKLRKGFVRNERGPKSLKKFLVVFLVLALSPGCVGRDQHKVVGSFDEFSANASHIDLSRGSWLQLDSSNEYSELVFRENGVLAYRTFRDSFSDPPFFENGSWSRRGNLITFSVNNGYSQSRAEIRGAVIYGTSWNIQGRRWTWTAKVLDQTNLDTVIDLIIYRDSRRWLRRSRYQPGSVHAVRILEASNNNRNMLIYAQYGTNSPTIGWVKVRFAGGQVNCLEFWDFPGQCRPLGGAVSFALGLHALEAAQRMTLDSLTESREEKRTRCERDRAAGILIPHSCL